MSKLQITSGPKTGPKIFTLNELNEGDVVHLHPIVAETPAYYMVFMDSNNKESQFRQKGLISLSGYGTARHEWAQNKKLVLVKSAVLHIEV